jgi:hypothetical protein
MPPAGPTKPGRAPADTLRDDVAIAHAKGVTAAPGMAMLLASVLMFAFSTLGTYLTFGREEDIEVTVMKWVQLRVNDRWADDLGRRIDERESSDKAFENSIRAVYLSLGFVANGFVLAAGLRMRALKNYSLCVTGAVVAIVLNGCSCVGFPVGVWAVLALIRPDVRAGFAATAGPAPNSA